MAEDITLTLPSIGSTARIILDWDDGHWYVSTLQNADGTISTNITANTASIATDSSSGVKVAVWDKDYKYNENDIVGFNGALYTSQQNANQDNNPEEGTFWWHPIVDLTHVDAITLEGKNLEEITRAVLGGNTISDYYKKTESDAIILRYVNNIDAKKLNGWSLENIKDDYTALIDDAKDNAQLSAIEYFISESSTSYQQSLIDEFNDIIASDDVNKF